VIGTTLAHYRITGELGSGGMGEVWRAEDEKLGREVALKLLPSEVAGDQERLARFDREAKVLARLNHANIATLYGLESVASGSGADSVPAAGTVTFLVMELVEGEDLSERISRGPIPIDEAIPIALQIAEALEAAHEAGIVHRDLKPANIKLTDDGTVKVLDFGLARGQEVSGGDPVLSVSPTLTQHATAAGVILGTASYMSPEQARGKAVDRRADIWSFGVVTWEMLTGTQLFRGDTVTDVLAAVLTKPPDLDELPPSTPEPLQRLIARCLEREPKNRLQWIGDARLDLTEAAKPRHEPAVPSDTAAMRRRRVREFAAWWTALLALVAALVVWQLAGSGPEPPVDRFSVVLEDSARLSLMDLPILDLSPDGRIIAFVAIDDEHGREMVFLRRLGETEVRVLEGTGGARNPFFSPDGSEIAFFADEKLRKIPIEGGSVVVLADAATSRGGTWSKDGSILYSPEYSSGLMKVESSGGTPEVFRGLDSQSGERTYRFPDVIPGGDAVIYTVGMMDSPNNYDDAKIVVFDPGSGTVKTLVDGGNMARWVDERTLVYSRAGVLYAASFDPDRLEVVGQPVPVIEDLGGDPSSGAGHFAAADNGTFVWVAGSVTENEAMLTVVNRDGTATRLPLEPRGFHQPRFSPDGSRVAVTVGDARSGVDGDIWIYSFADHTMSRLTFDGNGLYPVWSRDSKRIGFLSYLVRPSVLVRSADGQGGATTLTEGAVSPIFPESFGPDGSILAFTEVGQSSDIYLVSEGGRPELFQPDGGGPTISPNGRWVAFASPGSGSSSVFVRALDGEGKWQVSPDLGGYPRWSGDGRKLFYIDIGTPQRPLMEVEVDDRDGFRIGAPKVLIPDLGGRFLTTTAPATNWDAAPDGDRFIFVEFERDERARRRIEVALNWSQNLDLEEP
jgi:serine/threonine-protein kinase